MPDTTPSDRPRFVVCGANPMAYRLVDELVNQYDADVTVIMPNLRENWAAKIAEIPGAAIIESERLDADAFQRAGITEASALGLLDQSDAGNVDAALIAQELNPHLRVVMRMFNLSLGERVAQLLNDCVVLSAAAIAAPAFVAAALNEATSPPIQVVDRTLVATSRSMAAPGDIVCGLAITEGRTEPEILPDDAHADAADLVLAVSRAEPKPPRPARRKRTSSRLIGILLGARLRVLFGVMAVIFVLGTIALAAEKGFGPGSWGPAAYVTLLSELGGANIDPNAAALEKFVLVLLTIVSIALIPALTAAIVDSAVKARIRLESGELTEPIDDHIVVVGLGHVGTRVIRMLYDAGMDIVAIERDENARGVQVARELGIPVIIGDASRPEVLDSSSVATCRALVVVSTDDVTNLEISLLGRAAKPTLRVVLRLFDGEFADRVQRAFAINISRSVSYLAAPAFAAAMVGRQVIATIPVKRRVLLVAEIPIGAGSVLDGATAGSVEVSHATQVIGVRTQHSPESLRAAPPGRRLSTSDQLFVVATRAGLSHLLADAAPRPIDENVPYRLLDPSERPAAPRPRDASTDITLTSAEGPTGQPPVGPADETSERPA